MTPQDGTDLFIPEPSVTKSHMCDPCNLCHKPLLVLECEWDREWGWCHLKCVRGISTVGS